MLVTAFSQKKAREIKFDTYMYSTFICKHSNFELNDQILTLKTLKYTRVDYIHKYIYICICVTPFFVVH